MTNADYLKGCIREAEYLINEELRAPVSRYGLAMRDARCANQRDAREARCALRPTCRGEQVSVTIEYAPGRSVTYVCDSYLTEKAHPSLGLDAVYQTLHGRAACGGPYLDVTFNPTNTGGRKAQRLTVRVAVDGSWRGANADNHGLLLNCYGDAIL